MRSPPVLSPLLVLAVLLLGAVRAAPFVPAPGPPPPPPRAARPSGEGPEPYLLVPPSLDRGKPVRLLVLLHGEGGDERSFAERFRGAAGAANLVLLSFRGPRPLPGGGYAWWDPEDPRPGEALRAFYPVLVQAVRRAARSLGVERRLIVIAGFSQGAAAALQAGLEFPGLFAGGVIAFSGRGYGPACEGDGAARAAALGRRVALTAGLEERTDAEEGERAAERLNDRGVACALFAFRTGHDLPPHLEAVLERILAWLAE